MTRLLYWLKPRETPRKSEAEKRAEHWAKLTWPATRNAILETSRHGP